MKRGNIYFLDSRQACPPKPWRRRGQAVLAMVFLVGSVIIISATAIALLAASFVQVSFGLQASNRALAVAWAGANDALIQLVRNKDFTASPAYSVPVGSSTASVAVTQGVNQATIVSASGGSGYARSVTIVASVNSSTGQVSPLSWQLQ